MPQPTPTPSAVNLFGKTWSSYGPEVDQHMKAFLGDEFFRLLEEKEAGKSKVGPRPGYDYLMKQPMSPEDAAEVQRYLDMRSKHMSSIPSPTPTPTPTVNVPSTKKEADSWLQRLLGGDG